MIHFNCLDTVRQRRPLIHCISNIVSANDCANLALAVGASPIMAQAVEEMDAITAASSATVLNTGTPDTAKFDACLLCGRAAQAQGQPLVLDPVGVGASPWRLQRVREMLDLFTPSILRVNLGEARALLRMESLEQGVDSPSSAALEERLETAGTLALRRHTTVLLSGPEDIITDGTSAWCAEGGSGRYLAMPIHILPKHQPEKEETKMENVENKVVSAPVQTVAPNHEPETNPLDELCNTIDTFRNKLKLALDESTLLMRKVKEVQLAQKQKERDFIQAKRAIERIRMAI